MTEKEGICKRSFHGHLINHPLQGSSDWVKVMTNTIGGFSNIIIETDQTGVLICILDLLNEGQMINFTEKGFLNCSVLIIHFSACIILC